MSFSWIAGSKRYLRVAALGLMAWGALFGSASPLWAASVSVVLPDRSTGIPVVMILRRPYVDALAVAKLVSGRLQVDATQGHATLQMGSHSLAVRLGTAEVRIASRTVPLSSAPVLQDRRFLLPMDILPVLLAERFGQEAVEWIRAARYAGTPPGRNDYEAPGGAYPTHTRVVLKRSVHWSGPSSATRRETGCGSLCPRGARLNIRPITIRTGTVRGVQPTQHAGGAEVRLTREWGCRAEPSGSRTRSNCDRCSGGPMARARRGQGRRGVERTSQPQEAASLPPDRGQVAMRSTRQFPTGTGPPDGRPAVMTVVLTPDTEDTTPGPSDPQA
jgi:hypothetical protein